MSNSASDAELLMMKRAQIYFSFFNMYCTYYPSVTLLSKWIKLT